MRYFKFNELGEDQPVVMTDEQILSSYYPYWRGEMEKAGKVDLISNANCIEDWLVVHWGWEVKEDEV